MKEINGYTCYQDADLAKLAPVIDKARALMERELHNHEDAGTCVGGAGVAVNYVGPRQRKMSRKILVSAPFQGNTGSWHATRSATKFLELNGMDVHWYDGWMD